MLNPYKYVTDGYFKCPSCGRLFKTEYPSKTILGDWKHNAQLATSNFKRHCLKHVTTYEKVKSD